MTTKQLYYAEKAMQLETFNQRNKEALGEMPSESEIVGPDTPETKKAHDAFRLLPTCAKLERERNQLRLVVQAATVLIAAKGRHNTMLAYQGLRNALHPNAKSAGTDASEKTL